MTEEGTPSNSSVFADMRLSQLLQIALVGLIAGLATWGITFLAGLYVFKPVLCAEDINVCASANQYALVCASLIATGVALFILVKLRAYRPLLIVIAATVSLWGMVGMLSVFTWYSALGASMFLYALAYALFAWVVRVRMFWLAIIILVVLIVSVRLLLNS